MAKSLTEKTLSGLNWNFVNTYSNSFITFIIGIILARLLTPKDFGLVGMVVIFTGLADLFATLGLGKAIIKIKIVNKNQIGLATISTIISSIIIYISFYFLSPIIAEFYGEPKLIIILRVLSIIFILKGINTVSYSQIIKNLDFKTITKISVVSSITYGTVSIILALLNYGVWSLIIGKISSSLVATLLSLFKFPINLSFYFNKKDFKDLLGFGGGVSLSSLLFYGTSNVDYFFIGKMLNPTALGLYTKAFNFVSQTMGQITAGTSNVLFPAFSAVQDDKEKLAVAYIRVVKTVSYILIPILLSLIIVSDYLVLGLYGEKWSGAITPLKILLFAGALRVTLQYSGAIAHATGNVSAEVLRQLVYFIITAIGVYFLIDFGIEGVAFAILIARILMFIMLSNLALKIIKISWGSFLKAQIPALANSIVMVTFNLLLVYSLKNTIIGLPNELNLLIVCTFNVLFFFLTILLMPISLKGDTITWLLEKYKKYFPTQIIRFYYTFNTSKK